MLQKPRLYQTLYFVLVCTEIADWSVCHVRIKERMDTSNNIVEQSFFSNFQQF